MGVAPLIQTRRKKFTKKWCKLQQKKAAARKIHHYTPHMKMATSKAAHKNITPMSIPPCGWHHATTPNTPPIYEQLFTELLL